MECVVYTNNERREGESRSPASLSTAVAYDKTPEQSGLSPQLEPALKRSGGTRAALLAVMPRGNQSSPAHLNR